jgi:hypothetical protein
MAFIPDAGSLALSDPPRGPRRVKGRMGRAAPPRQPQQKPDPEREAWARTLADIGPLDHCILCGCMMHSDVDRRYKTVQYMAWLAGVACQRTPFVYTHIMECAKLERRAHAEAHRRAGAAGQSPPCTCCGEDGDGGASSDPPRYHLASVAAARDV